VNISAQLRKIPAALWLWLTVFTVYLPAWRAGFVTDAIDWLHDARTLPFRDYLNRPHSTVHALYQLTQLVTLGFYKLFGTARLPWHLLFVTLQAGAAYMLYQLCGRIIGAANLPHPRRIAFWGAFVFCISPYLSEVVVWKACFHYLQGFILMLAVLICVERYIYTRHRSLPWIAAGIFLIATFSLELFYLTPLFTATLLYYYCCLGWDMAVSRRTWYYFLIPQMVIFAFHLVLFHATYGEWASHGTGGFFAASLQHHLATGAKYIFHLLLFGRFWPQELKENIYALCEKWSLIIPLYSALACLLGWLFYRCRQGYGREQASLLFLLWILLGIGLALPMPFERLFDLSGNRYLYLPVAFFSMLLILTANAIRIHWLKVGLVWVWCLASAYFLLRTNRHWQTSEKINASLLQNAPIQQGRTTILLSMPYCYKGIPMINSWPQSNFKRMHNALLSPPITGEVYDASAFNMISPNDGSEAEIVNDSTIKVTLKQWGTWWWYMDFGGRSYETPDYKLNMVDQGHWYELILKRPISNYNLLQQVGDKWQILAPK
jgi:hypothetical protein